LQTCKAQNLQIIDQSMSKRRVFAGNQLRALRTRRGLLQTGMARALGISASYLCQLENDERHLTPALADRLRAQFPVDWEDLAPDRQDLLADALRQAVADPLLPAALPSEQIERVAEQFPAFAEQFVRMHAIHRRDRQRLEMLDEALGSDSVAAITGGRLPWEEVRDWFHLANNYVDLVDRHAEILARELAPDQASPSIDRMEAWFAARGVTIDYRPGGPLRLFDPAAAAGDRFQPAGRKQPVPDGLPADRHGAGAGHRRDRRGHVAGQRCRASC
jgi:transcriptional regulator with XRE-family HTH domain